MSPPCFLPVSLSKQECATSRGSSSDGRAASGKITPSDLNEAVAGSIPVYPTKPKHDPYLQSAGQAP